MSVGKYDRPVTTPGHQPLLARQLESRYSCRSFLPDTVPTATIRQLFRMAQRTPSWCNSQAWQVNLVSGAATRRFADALLAHVDSHQPDPDLPGPERYTGVYQDRRRASGFALYSALGIARDDFGARQRQLRENHRFFGAPHVAVVSTPADLGVYGAVDCGGYVATLLLAAESLDLGAIAQAAIAMYAGFVRSHLEIPDDRRIVCAVSFGYADDLHPANGFRTERADIDDVVLGLPG
jgi:nitroreductase